MGLAGSEIFYKEGGGAQQLKGALLAVLEMYKGAGKPFGDTCPCTADFSTYGHLLDVSALSTAIVRLFWRFQHNRGSMSEAECDLVKTQVKVLVIATMQSFKVDGMVTGFLVESSRDPRFVLLLLNFVSCFFVLPQHDRACGCCCCCCC